MSIAVFITEMVILHKYVYLLLLLLCILHYKQLETLRLTALFIKVPQINNKPQLKNSFINRLAFRCNLAIVWSLLL